MSDSKVPKKSRRRRAEKQSDMSVSEIEKMMRELEEEMLAAAEELRFEYAAKLRDEIRDLRREFDAATACFVDATDFGWLWAAYAASVFGTYFAFDAFPLIAILVLDVGPAAVSALAAAGLAVGALVAIPLGPWVEFRHKRPVMIGMDVVRCLALLTVPVRSWLDWLTLTQLVLVSVIVAACGIAFRAASGAYVKGLVPPEELLRANARFESTTWTAAILGPPLGGAAIGLLGPAMTVVANARELRAVGAGLRAIRAPASRAPHRGRGRRRHRRARSPMSRRAGGSSSATPSCGRCS